MFHSVLDTLAGGQKEPSMDPATGAISEQPVHRTGGEWARRLLAGAFTGLAAGAEAPVRPGAGAVSGLGAGFAGETANLNRQDATKRQQLQKNFENQQQVSQQDTENKLRQAQTAYYTTQNSSLAFELVRSKAEATDKAVDTFNAFQKAVAANPDNQDLGVFPDMASVIAYEKQHPELTKQIAGHASGQIVAVPDLVQAEDSSWKYQGVRAALVKPDVMQQTVGQVFGQGEVPGIPYFVPGKMTPKGQEAGTWQVAQPAPNTKYGDYLAALQKGSADAAKENDALALAQTKAQEATASAEEARGENLRAQTQQLLGGGIDELGRPLPPLKLEERNKRYDTFTKNFVQDKDQLEQSYGQMQSILQRAANGTMTGADSVVGLFNAIGISSAPLKGRGFRINQNIVGEHAAARNIFQSAAAALSKLTPNGSGEVITPKQLGDYTSILGQARHDLYVTMAQEAQRQGLPKDFLPQGGGKSIDVPTAKIFLDSYGGDPQVALAAARKFGWTVPQAPGSTQ